MFLKDKKFENIIPILKSYLEIINNNSFISINFQ